MTDRQAGRWCGLVAVVGMLGLLSFCLITSGPALWAEYNAPPRPPQPPQDNIFVTSARALGELVSAILVGIFQALAEKMNQDAARFELAVRFLQAFFAQFIEPTRPLWELLMPSAPRAG